jgi:hypothetical protein
MRELGPGPQETSFMTTPWEKIAGVVAFLKRQANETDETRKELMRHPEVKQGGEAALRSAINIAISCFDVVPVAGEITSWGADALKIIEEVRYRSRIKEATARNEDCSGIKREPYNLTPDVGVYTATLTEIIELLTLSMFPTHAIETVGQLWFDLPRIYRGVQKAREGLRKIREKRENARKAADYFKQPL